MADAQAVLRSTAPIEREIEAQGAWYIRRISPYRAQDNAVEGVVITFTEITERRNIAKELELAKQQAEAANATKSRFLAAASHDLRQPLQTLALLQGLLARVVEGERAEKLVGRFDETLGAIEGMLNTMLDINQIETGTVHTEPVTFPLNDLLERLKDEFTYHAQAKGLVLRVVRCSLLIHSDPRLLEQMIRNLVSNALKYTKRGKVLLGCRRHKGMLSIEVCDTGIGIADKDLQKIFEEYLQLDNAARERSRGLGLGLSIVQRLGTLLGHRVRVRSQPDQGSVFAIEVALPLSPAAAQPPAALLAAGDRASEGVRRVGTILVVEDDPEVRELLEIFLADEGHQATTASDGMTALALVARGEVRPDIILADFNLPNGMNGLEVAAKLQESLGHPVAAIVLTGDTSTSTLRQIELGNSIRLSKPVKLADLTQVIQRLLAVSQSAVAKRAPRSAEPGGAPGSPTIFIVDDDSHIREGLREVLEENGRVVEAFETCEAFLAAYHPGREACLILDAYLPGMDGIELIRQMSITGSKLPVIMITGNSDVPMAIQAMKAGAIDFIEKPVHREELLASIERAMEQSRDSGKLSAWRDDATSHLSGLTVRQRQIMELVLAGHASKNIAANLGISQRTVENHRASIMKKSGSKSLPALARLAIAAAESGDD
jgi:two-component system CheB/CheR fusion protein